MVLGETQGLQGRLQDLLNEAASETTTPFSVHVRTADGAEAGVVAEQPEPAASLAKAPLLAALEAAWAERTIDRRPQDAALARKMITRSDNAAADELLKRIGAAKVNIWLDSQGYRLTRLGSGFTPPKIARTSTTSAGDMSRLMLDLARGALVSEKASAEMRSWFEAQTRRGRIPAGLPPGAVCGNKTGTLDSLTHDAAYVIPPGSPPYGIAVLINAPGSETEHSALIKSLSRKVYGLLSRR